MFFLKFLKQAEWPQNSFSLPRLQAHRGYWLDGAPENTIPAFRAAKQKGALMFEFDVRLSRDGIPIVFHDLDLTRACGNSSRTHLLTAEEIFQRTGAPTLEAVLTDPLVPDFFNIELKTQPARGDALVRKVASLIQFYGLEARVLFSSFNPLYIWQLAQFLPCVPRALLVTDEPGEGNSWIFSKMLLAPLLEIQLLHLDKRMVSPKDVENLKEKGIKVAVWTVNDPEEIKNYLSAGAESIISDSLGLNSPSLKPS